MFSGDKHSYIHIGCLKKFFSRWVKLGFFNTPSSIMVLRERFDIFWIQNSVFVLRWFLKQPIIDHPSRNGTLLEHPVCDLLYNKFLESFFCNLTPSFDPLE